MKGIFRSFVSMVVAASVFLNYAGLSLAQSVVLHHNEQGATTVTTEGANINIRTTDGSISVYGRMGSEAHETINIAHDTVGSVALHRVEGPVSVFNGRLVSNGRDFITNTNGIIWGNGATVDAPGLVASSLNISNADFNAGLMSGQFKFVGSSANGAVINNGLIRITNGGYVALLAPQVRNSGVIVADAGRVLLASGEAMTVNLDDAADISAVVTAGALQGSVTNDGRITALGGKIVLTAKSLEGVLEGVINMTGTLEADEIVIDSDSGVTLSSDATIGGVSRGGMINIDGSSIDTVIGELLLDGGIITISEGETLTINSDGSFNIGSGNSVNIFDSNAGGSVEIFRDITIGDSDVVYGTWTSMPSGSFLSENGATFTLEGSVGPVMRGYVGEEVRHQANAQTGRVTAQTLAQANAAVAAHVGLSAARPQMDIRTVGMSF